MLSGLNLQQRREMFTRVSDDTLAGILVVMAVAQRQKLLQEVADSLPDLSERVLRHIRCVCVCVFLTGVQVCLEQGPYEQSESLHYIT